MTPEESKALKPGDRVQWSPPGDNWVRRGSVSSVDLDTVVITFDDSVSPSGSSTWSCVYRHWETGLLQREVEVVK